MSDFVSLRLRSLGMAPGLVAGLGLDGARLLPLCREIGAGQVILTEPDARAAARLRTQAGDGADVTVIEALAAGRSGPAEIALRSVRRFSGLRPATGLTALFPGLHDTGRAEITAIDAGQLLAHLPEPEPEAGAPQLLILGPTGEEGALLTALAAADALQRFDHVFLTLPAAPLFEGAATAAELTARLAESGFRLAARDAGDPDMPVSHFHLDRQVLAQARLLEERQRELDALRAAGRGATPDDATDLTRALQAARDEAETHRTALAAARQELEQLRQGSAGAPVGKPAGKLAENPAGGAEIEALRAELDAARQGLTLALRTQALRENDLHDLQAQYAALQEQLRARDALLAQLSRHVEQAIDCLPAPRGRTGRTAKTAGQKTGTQKTGTQKTGAGRRGTAKSGKDGGPGKDG